MRSCPESDRVRAVLAAEENLDEGLREHVRACAVCATTAARFRSFDARLTASMDALITDAMPDGVLLAARMKSSELARRPSVRMILAGLASAALMLFALVGLATTGFTVYGVLAPGSSPAASPEEGLTAFQGCYLRDLVLVPPDDEDPGSSPAAQPPQAVALEPDCLAVVGHAPDREHGYTVVATFQTPAEATTACLRALGWDVAPKREDGRWVTPDPPEDAAADDPGFVRDVETCTMFSSDQQEGAQPVAPDGDGP